MRPSRTGSPFIDNLLQRTAQSDEKAERIAGRLNASQLNWRPAPDAWGVGHCLEHLRAAAAEYLVVLEPCLSRAREKDRTAPLGKMPRHTWMGRLLIDAVSPKLKRKMKAPRKIRPVAEAPEDILAQFLATERRLAVIIEESAGLNLEKARMSSPMLRIIRLNAADAFEVLVAHVERHLNQAEAVTRHPEFPR